MDGDQRFVLDGRQVVVMGSKDVSDEQGKKSLLVVQDQLSGDIEYWLPALRFSLVPGNDYEGFIRGNQKLRRMFVNNEYAEVGVEAADIADQYHALARDPRVAGLRLVPVPVRAKSR